MAKGRSRLFSGIVVLGAQITAGCGGEATDTSRSGPSEGSGGSTSGAGGISSAGVGGLSSGAAGAGGRTGPTEVTDCPRPETFLCDDYKTLQNCRCDDTVEIPTTCPSQRLDCTCTSSGPFGYSHPCAPAARSSGDAIACGCRIYGPLVPTDCQNTSQFYCQDWATKTNCTRDTSLPTDPAACGLGDYWTCFQDTPPVGCRCLTRIG